jgi:hypothetical protein
MSSSLLTFIFFRGVAITNQIIYKNGLVEGKIYRKSPYLDGKTMVSG